MPLQRTVATAVRWCHCKGQSRRWTWISGSYSNRIRRSLAMNLSTSTLPLHWHHNDHDGVSNHQPHGYLLSRLFRRRSKKTSKLRVNGLCVGNSPGPVNSPHKGPVTQKIFPFDDVIMHISFKGLMMDVLGLLTPMPVVLSHRAVRRQGQRIWFQEFWTIVDNNITFTPPTTFEHRCNLKLP